MTFPSTAALLADELGSADAAAYDLSAGCTGFMYALVQGYGMLAGGLAERALIVGATSSPCSRLDGPLDPRAVSATGRGGVARARRAGRVPRLRARSGRSGGMELFIPAAGSRLSENGPGHLTMNGREVFKFATRVMVQLGGAVLAECGRTVDEIDVYVPTRRISASSSTPPGSWASRGKSRDQRRPVREHVVRLDSAGSGRCRDDGRLKPGKLVLMTGMAQG